MTLSRTSSARQMLGICHFNRAPSTEQFCPKNPEHTEHRAPSTEHLHSPASASSAVFAMATSLSPTRPISASVRNLVYD